MPPVAPEAAMRKAITDNDVAKVQQLLSSGVSPDIIVNKIQTNPALVYAAEQGKEAIVQALIAAGANLNKQDKHGNTALMKSKQNPTISNMLLDAGADINIRNNDGETALISLISGQSPVVIRLIDAGADVNALGNFNETVLGNAVHYAEGEIGLNIVKRLIEAGADLNNHGRLQRAPLVSAALSGKIPIVKELVRAGADKTELMRILQPQDEMVNNNNRYYQEEVPQHLRAAVFEALEELPPATNHIIPRGTLNSITMDEIQDGNRLTNFRRNPQKYESNLGEYYKRSTVLQLRHNPHTRGPIEGKRNFIARFAAEGGRRRRKTRATRRHRRRTHKRRA